MILIIIMWRMNLPESRGRPVALAPGYSKSVGQSWGCFISWGQPSSGSSLRSRHDTSTQAHACACVEIQAHAFFRLHLLVADAGGSGMSRSIQQLVWHLGDWRGITIIDVGRAMRPSLSARSDANAGPLPSRDMPCIRARQQPDPTVRVTSAPARMFSRLNDCSSLIVCTCRSPSHALWPW